MTLNAPCLEPGSKYLIWMSSFQIYSAFREIDEEILGAVRMYSASVKKKKKLKKDVRGEERSCCRFPPGTAEMGENFVC